MVLIRSREQNKVLNELRNTHPDFVLCTPENHCRLIFPKIFPISNESRFYNERCQEILQTWKDIGDVFHRFPDIYQKKMIASRAFRSLFETQIFSTLDNEARKNLRKKKLTASEEKNMALLIKLYTDFFRIGLNGLIRLMPSEFTHLLSEQVKPIVDNMFAINDYTRRIAPEKAKLSLFPFTKPELGL